MNNKLFLYKFTKEILISVRYSFGLLIAASLISGVMQSIGVFLLFPLLEAAHVLPDQGHSGRIQHSLTNILNFLGLEINLTLILFLFVCLVGLRNTVVRWQTILGQRVVLAYINELRKKLYEAIVAAEWLYFCRHKPAHFTQVLTSDLNRIGQGVYDVNLLVSQVLLLCSYGIAAFLINWQITFWVALGGLVAVVFQQRMAQKAYALGFHNTKQDKNLYQWINETLNNLKLIKPSNNETQMSDAFNKIVDANNHIHLKSCRHYADLNFFFQLYSTLILVGFIYLSVTQLQLPSSSLLILIFVFSRMMPLVSTIWGHINHLRHIQAAHESYTQLYLQCQQHRLINTVQAYEPLNLNDAIIINNINFSYRPGIQANVLKAINLKIPAKKITTFIGVSGSGKTTLCDLITGLFKPLTGKILIDSTELTEQHLNQWRSQIIYVTQDAFLFDDTIRNNLLWYQKGASDQLLCEALKSAQLYEWFSQLPEGLDTLIGSQGVRLSGGEKQRLVLARAFLKLPSLLILDEASSALDKVNEQQITQVIQKFRHRATVIMITHRLHSIKMADHIVVIDQGRITEKGNWQSLPSKDKNLISELLT